MSFAVSASALGVLVRAHDSPDSPLDSLYETFIPRSEEHISDGLAWFYCGGLSIALASMAVIALTHSHRKIPHQRLAKCWRLTARVAIALAILLLPLAHLNSLQLVGTSTGLVLCVLFLELVGSTCVGDNIFWDARCGRGKCEYSANCKMSRKELKEQVKEGGVVDVEEIARREGGEKGVVGAV